MSFNMMKSRVLMTYCVRRYINTSIICEKSYLPRQGKFMSKMIYSETKKKTWHVSRENKSYQPFSPTTTKLVSPHVTRRVIVLNKVFMEYVTDIMATGEVSAELVGRGVEISEVKLSNDFQYVRVYWFSSEKDPKEQLETENRLDQCAFRLRHELSQLKVIGVVPPIKFVKDRRRDRTADIDKLMSVADYGEDYAPALKIKPVVPELVLYSKLSEKVREEIIEISGNEGESNKQIEEEEEDDGKYDVDLPLMKHDVLGLNHFDIMSRVKQSLKKVRAVKDKTTDTPSVEAQQEFNPALITPLRTNEEAQAFSDFLLKRQIEEKRKEKWALANLYNYNFNDSTYNDNENEEIFEEPDIDGFEDIDPKELH